MAITAFNFDNIRLNFNICGIMAKQEIFVTVYRIEIYEDYSQIDSFIEAISDYAVVYCDDCNILVTASSEALSLLRLASTAIKFFGSEGYIISTLGLLGPLKKLN